MFRNGCLLRFEEFYSKEVKIGLELENPLLQWNTTHPSKGSGRVVVFCFQFWKSIKARALYMLGKHSTTKPLFALFCLRHGWPPIPNHPASASQVLGNLYIHFRLPSKFEIIYNYYSFSKKFLHFTLPFFWETKDKNIRFSVIAQLLFEPLLISFSFFLCVFLIAWLLICPCYVLQYCSM